MIAEVEQAVPAPSLSATSAATSSGTTTSAGTGTTSAVVFNIRQASLADARAMASCFKAAFAAVPMFGYFYDIRPEDIDSAISQAKYQEAMWWMRGVFRSFLCEPSFHHFVALDVSGDIAGFSIWRAVALPHRVRSLTWLERIVGIYYRVSNHLWNKVLPFAIQRLFVPTLGTQFLVRRRDGGRRQMEHLEHYLGKEERERGCWKLIFLAVHPNHQRRGLANRLLQWGIEKADEDEKNIWLSATESGYSSYKKVGFTTRHEWETDGGEAGKWREFAMARPLALRS